MRGEQADNPDYILGHSEEELQRLVNQSRFYGDLTEQVFVKAGILEGIKPGGVVAFQEMDMSGIRSTTRLPLFEQTASRIVETFRRGGIESLMGLKLYRTFLAAGLPAPEMIMGARVEGGPDSPAYEVMAQVARTLLPMMEKLGVAKAAEVQVETLALRLRDEAVADGGVVVPPPFVGAWARRPHS